jgi:hypothetical protein
MELNRETYKFKTVGSIGKISLIIGVLGIVLCAIGFLVDSRQFFYSYLAAYTFWLTIVVSGLFFVMLQHLVNAVWSIVVRRLAESLMMAIPLMAILFIPVIFGIHDLYLWSHPDVVATDKILQGKSGFLNIGFFIVRSVVYFAVWFLLAWSVYKASIAQDSGFDEKRVARVRRISAIGVILFAFTVTYAAFDWIMSLDPHWYSTIFGVYVFAGGLLAVIAFMSLAFIYLRKQGILKDEVTMEHYHDLGKLLFAFMVFWAYIAFSQYLLIWYADIPEEIIWYQHRWVGSWKIFSLLIPIGHFGIPFVIMITRGAKRSLKMMTVMSLWLLAMHWVDVYWLVLPNLSHENMQLSWMDAASLLAVTGLVISMFWRTFTSNAVLPVTDPRLGASIRFTNM